MEISVIIISYNTSELLNDCLRSVFQNTVGLSFEVIVVDNNSKDDSCQMVETLYPQVKLIRSCTNLGFGKANNIGISQAKGKYVFLLNSDCVLINNAIKILHDLMERVGHCAVSGGNLFNREMKPVHAYGCFNSPMRYFLRITGLRYLLKNTGNEEKRDRLTEVEQIVGADLMIRKSVLDEVGVFDERFFLYCEESELQFRIRKKGYGIVYTPEAKIFHLEGASTKKNKKLRRYTIIKSEYLFLSICYPEVPKTILRLLCTVPNLYRCFHSPCHVIKALKFVWSTR